MFFETVGKMALGSRLRMLSERITEEAKEIYASYEVGLKPKWFPVFYTLSKGKSRTVMAIAEEIGQSHPSVIKTLGEMLAEDIIVEERDPKDGRKKIIELSKKGKMLAVNIEDQYLDVNNALEEMLDQTRHNLWTALEEFESLLEQQSVFDRVRKHKKEREKGDIQLVPYEPKYHSVFKRLNEAWITQYFEIEEADSKALEDPQGYILDQGGMIMVALYKDEPVGVCAMLSMDDAHYDFELAKMGVSPEARGKGIGELLVTGLLDEARRRGGQHIYLESNTRLEPAIKLYQKLGFTKIFGRPTPYVRSNIQMELNLDVPDAG